MENTYKPQNIYIKGQNNYENQYSENKFLEKIKKSFLKAGSSLVYAVFLLFYSLKDPKVPAKAKAIIIGALGYFIAPIDLILDTVPGVGFTDDLAAVVTALGAVAMYITDETKEKAREKTKQLFKNVKDSDFQKIDDKIMNR